MNSKNFFTSLRILLKGLVLNPVADLIVFPCIGSHDQTTFSPSFLTALISFGKNLSTFSDQTLILKLICQVHYLDLRILQVSQFLLVSKKVPLKSNRIFYSSTKLNMATINLSCSVSNPNKVC